MCSFTLTFQESISAPGPRNYLDHVQIDPQCHADSRAKICGQARSFIQRHGFQHAGQPRDPNPSWMDRVAEAFGVHDYH